MIVGSQIATIIAWIIILFNLIAPINGYSSMINWIGLGLLGAHLVETIVFLPKAKKVGGSLALHALMLLIFGYVHNMVLDKQLAAKS